MSETTRKMAQELYRQMSSYVGADHEGRCVEALNFTLDSMEANIQSLQQECEALKEQRGCVWDHNIATENYPCGCCGYPNLPRGDSDE